MRFKNFLIVPLTVFFFCGFAQAAIYQYRDETGNLNITDDYNKIPQKFRSQLKVSAVSKNKPSINRTVVKFRREGSSIFVNATLNYSRPVIFHLDTGATNTMILEEDALNLGLDLKNAPRIKSRIADGRTLSLPLVQLSSIRVGEAEIWDIKVVVGKVRLLGLNFLKNFKMTVDSASGNLILEAPEKVMRVESEAVRLEKKKAADEYEIKVEKSELQIKAVKKNIELLEVQIEEYQDKKFEIEDKLREAVERNASQSQIDRLESMVQQYDLAIEGRQLNQETYTKDIDILKNNINYYDQKIRELQ